MHHVYFLQAELVINQDVWVVILGVKMAIICQDVAVIIYVYLRKMEINPMVYN